MPNVPGGSILLSDNYKFDTGSDIFDAGAYTGTHTKSSASVPAVNNSRSDITKDLQDNRIYFSGAQCEISIGGYMLEEAVEVEGSYNLDQIPIYGYASSHFNTVGQGRVIVTGSIIINYRYDGYLLAHINKAKAVKDQNALAAGKSYTTQQASISDSGKVVFDNSTVKAFQKLYWGTGKSRSLQVRPEFTKGPFDIKIKDFRIGAMTQEAEEKTIVDCFITRMATVRRSDSTPTVEVYQFIARSII